MKYKNHTYIKYRLIFIPLFSPTDFHDAGEQMNDDESLNNGYKPRKIDFIDGSTPNSSACDSSLNDYLDEAMNSAEEKIDIGDEFNNDSSDDNSDDDGNDTFDCNNIMSPLNKVSF